jgi:hypothetical protein
LSAAKNQPLVALDELGLIEPQLDREGPGVDRPSFHVHVTSLFRDADRRFRRDDEQIAPSSTPGTIGEAPIALLFPVRRVTREQHPAAAK